MNFPRWTSFKSFVFQGPREVAAFNHENLQTPERRRSAYFAGQRRREIDRHRAGAAHKMHHHPNNFLSGVYYVRTRAGADTINFHDPRIQSGIIRPPVVELTAENTDQVVVRVKDGTMLVFPAYLQHSVDASASEEERISISFNILFSSFTENLSKPLW